MARLPEPSAVKAVGTALFSSFTHYGENRSEIPSRPEENFDIASVWVLVLIHIAALARNKIGDRDWAEVSNVVWLADGSGLVMVGRDGGRNNQIWLVPYPSGETRKITSD